MARIDDKNQRLVLLTARRWPWPIAVKNLFATLVNRAATAWLGAELAQRISPLVLPWEGAGSFQVVAM